MFKTSLDQWDPERLSHKTVSKGTIKMLLSFMLTQRSQSHRLQSSIKQLKETSVTELKKCKRAESMSQPPNALRLRVVFGLQFLKLYQQFSTVVHVINYGCSVICDAVCVFFFYGVPFARCGIESGMAEWDVVTHSDIVMLVGSNRRFCLFSYWLCMDLPFNELPKCKVYSKAARRLNFSG